MKDKNLLSIGEFSTLTGLSIKSLRYYDRIDVLKPLYVDKDTSYRYYTREQIEFANIIFLSLEAEIPLTTIKDNFINDGEIDFERLLDYSKTEVDKKLKKLVMCIDNINALKELSNAKKEYVKNGYYKSKLWNLYLILMPYTNNIDSEDYEKFIGNNFKTYAERNIYIGSLYGILKIKDIKKQYVFFETSKDDYEKVKKNKKEITLFIDKKEYEYRLLNNQCDVEMKENSNIQIIAKTMDQVLENNTYQIIDILD